MRSVLKPEVELVIFLCMNSDKITKNGDNGLKMSFEGLISAYMYIFLETGNSILRSILKPAVEEMVFLRMLM